MYKIGDFSRMGQVSVRMLRHYDQIGLLKPEGVDAFSGYRNYSIKQLPTLNRILFLKDLGFSLQQISELLLKNLPLDELKSIHRERQEKLEKEMFQAKSQLAMVKLRLEQIENEGKEPLYEVMEKSAGSFIFASIRRIIPEIKDMAFYCKTIHEELYQKLNECGVTPGAPETTLYHNKEYKEENIDVEIGVKLNKDYRDLTKLPKDLIIRKVESETRVASLLYKGPYENTISGVLELLNWIGLNNWHITGAVREIQLSGPTHDENGIVQSDPVSELQIPIKN
ncbi:MAG: MerR family transcriptional regulator [Spirochaetaceae bacterium]